MREKVPNVVLYQNAETGLWIANTLEPGSKALHNENKGIVLNYIKKLLLTFKVVVKPRERNARSPADIANGSALETVLGEDLG
jgi:hypothetical protein